MPPLVTLQDISGVRYSDYQTNQAVYDSVLQQTIVDSVSGIFWSGISRSTFHDFLVTAGSSRRALSEASSLRPPAGSSDPASLSSSTAASIRAQYRLVLTGTGRSYDDVRTQLEGAVQSGSFDASLRSNALAQGVAGLSNATSGSLSVQDETDYSSNSDDDAASELLSMSAIIGIAVGGAVLLCILISACVWWYRSTPHSTNAASIGAQQKTASSVSTDDPNPQSYDVVISAEPDKEELGLGEGELGELELTPSAPAPEGIMAVAEIVPYTQLYSATDEEQANL